MVKLYVECENGVYGSECTESKPKNYTFIFTFNTAKIIMGKSNAYMRIKTVPKKIYDLLFERSR